MTVKSLKTKVLVILILIAMFFTNCGYTICAIATSEDFKIISKGLFGKDEIKFDAYFVDSNGKETSQIIGEVNERVKLVLEVTPQVEGVLKSGTIKLVPSEEGELNFKLTGTIEDKIEEIKNSLYLEQVDSNEDEEEQPEVKENAEETNEVQETEEETKNENPLTSALSSEQREIDIKSNSVENTTNPLTSALSEIEKQEKDKTAEEVEETEQEEIVDEEELIENKVREAELIEELQNAISDIQIKSENEISLSYIKGKATIEVELEYLQKENLTVDELMQKIKVQMSGKYIDTNLEEKEIGKEEELTIGWRYSKEIELTSEYTKVSPFEVGEVKGTIVESRIRITREEDRNYLPLKNMRLEVEAPSLYGENPKSIEINAVKLMATRGEDIGEVTFGDEDWEYDEENRKIIITVNNEEEGKAKNTVGEDEFVIVYRYDKYVEGEPDLSKVVKATVEEYSSPENIITEKEINEKKEVKIDVGEIVTYNAGAMEKQINKAKIYANYNSEEALYETEIKTQVSVNILTSDVLKSMKINASEENYKDINKTKFTAKDIKVKQVKFNFSEIKNLLQNGGRIVLKNGNEEVIYVLTNEVVNSEEDVLVSLNNCEGLIIETSEIGVNGILNFEITKIILKPEYEKSAFKSFVELESNITAEIEYKETGEKISLEGLKETRKFEESKTEANIVLGKSSLSTLKSNENIELKIELNNDKEDSDLYVNPSFEIVFPKYVTAVGVENINLLYDEGLRVLDFETSKDSDGIIKIRIDLIGTQTKFSESSITNGTNIVLNLNIEVDDYTPSKEDQIKLYYCNEGVTNYQTQTKWTIERRIPSGILKATNGFDVELINYQAPSGLVLINGIKNYDGNLGELTSVKQGEVKGEIPRESGARIASMELVALNNTGNECTDVILIGRIPFAGNKDVVTNQDMGTTLNTKILDKIKANVENKYLTTIYYSTKEDANQHLDDEGNGWTEEPEDLSKVKSYLIEVKGGMQAGTALTFTYDFEIPENLKYNEKLVGSFGGYYNNNTKQAIIYESSSADKVVLGTEAGMQVDLKLDVDIGNGNAIKSGKVMKYTVTVENSGSVALEDAVLSMPIPKHTEYVEKNGNSSGDGGYGEYRIIEDEDETIEYVLSEYEEDDEHEEGEYEEYSEDDEENQIDEYTDEESVEIVDDDEYSEEFILNEDDEDTEEENEEFILDEDDEGIDEATEEFILNEDDEDEEYLEDEDEDEEADLYENIFDEATDHVEMIRYNLGKFIPGKSITFSYYVRTEREKYIENTNETINIINKAIVSSSTLAKELESNETNNPLIYTNFSSIFILTNDGNIVVGQKDNYKLRLKNVSGNMQKNVSLVFNMGQVYDYDSVKVDGKIVNAKVDNTKGKIYINIGNMNTEDMIDIDVYVVGKKTDENITEDDCYFEISAYDIESEYTNIYHRVVEKGLLMAEDYSGEISKELNEGDELTISTKMTNSNESDIDGVYMDIVIPDRFEIEAIESDEDDMLYYEEVSDEKYRVNLSTIESGDFVIVDARLIVKNIEGTEEEQVKIERLVHCINQEDIIIPAIEIIVLNNEKTEDEIIASEEIENKQDESEEHEENGNQEENESNEIREENNDYYYLDSLDIESNNSNDNSNNTTTNEENNLNDNQINYDNQTNTEEIPTNNVEEQEKTEEIQNQESENIEQNSVQNSDNSEVKENQEDNQNEEIINKSNETTNSNESKSNSESNSNVGSIEKYSISGKAWLDINNNGALDDGEKGISGIKTYLYTSSDIMLKSTTTNSNGEYKFEDLEGGEYSIGFNYDNSLYQLSPYKKNGVVEDKNSDVISVEEGSINATTNQIKLSSNLEDVNIGLQNKDTFNLILNKYISNISVETRKNTKEYSFNNEELTKVEIKSREINGAKVKLEYNIIVENVGNVEGYVDQIVDYIEEGLEFNEADNPNWYMGTDGYIYSKKAKETLLKSGDIKEYKLILTKTMNEENTGFILNKASLNVTSKGNLKEDVAGNSSVQNTYITVSTGGTRYLATSIVILFIISSFIYMDYKGIIKIKKKIYSSKKIKQNSTKRIYK